VGVVGYAVAHALAAEQLRCGVDVIVECVNPLAVTRDAWQQLACDVPGRLVEVEMICSDREEHRRRAETRTIDIEGHRLPTWADIVTREYEPWTRDRMVIDSAATSADDAVIRIGEEAWPAAQASR
jgi:predicted kinase